MRGLSEELTLAQNYLVNVNNCPTCLPWKILTIFKYVTRVMAVACEFSS